MLIDTDLERDYLNGGEGDDSIHSYGAGVMTGGDGADNNRHHTVELILEEKQNDRLFKDWSMAFFEFEAFESKAEMKLMQIDQIFKQSKSYLVNTSLTKTFFDQARSMLL